MSTSSASPQRHAGRYLYPIVLFVLAAAPRLTSLGAFMTPDERRWMERSVDLLRAFLTGNLSLAFHEGNPAGITTKWLGMAGIWARYVLHQLGWRAHLDPGLAASKDLPGFLAAVQAQPANPLDVLPAARVPVALVTALMVVAIYVVVRRLWGERVALIGGALIALDPFFLAHSRVLHQDALVSGFVVLSVCLLALALHMGDEPGVSWPALIGSGALAGLAALTKPTALALGPWACGWVVVWAVRRRIFGPVRVWTALAVLAAWGGALALVFYALWPAMWTNPIDTALQMWARSEELAAAGHNQFFFGQATNDPGALFYPVVWLFRTTPLVGVGLAALAWRLAANWRLPSRLPTQPGGLCRKSGNSGTWLALFVVLFIVAISFSAKKNDRYVLPAILLCDILAAIGLSALWDRARRRGMHLALAVLALGQAALVIAYHPYYLAYYNPLVGGPVTAPRVLLIGWGEGLDQVGRYLSAKTGAAELSASSYYRREFSPYFPGQVRKLANDDPREFDLVAWHASDYVVSYVSQRQTDQPDEATMRYLGTQTPERVIRIRGIDYAWIYRTPEYVPDELIPAKNVVRRTFGSEMLFLGYDPPSVSVQPAEPAVVRVALYWQSLAVMSQDYLVDLRLVDAAGKVWAEDRSNPYHEQYPTSKWPRGTILRDVHELEVPAGLSAGDYRLAVGLVSDDTGARLAPESDDVIIDLVHLGGGQASR